MTCYLPNGLPGESYYTPCNASRSNSHCCFLEDACLSNGYCFSTRSTNDSWGLRIERGMCTDWNVSVEESGCAGRCPDVMRNTTVTVDLVQDSLSGGWCCLSEYNTSSQTCIQSTHGSTEPFILDPGQVIYDRSTGAVMTNGTLPSIATVTSLPTASSSSSDDNTATIAIAIAVPLGIMFLVSLATVLFLNSKLRRIQRDLVQQQPRVLNEMNGRLWNPGYQFAPPQARWSWGFKRRQDVPVSEVPAAGPMPELEVEEPPQEIGVSVERGGI